MRSSIESLEERVEYYAKRRKLTDKDSNETSEQDNAEPS